MEPDPRFTRQTDIELTPYSLAEISQEVQAEYFPQLSVIEVNFAMILNLACLLTPLAKDNPIILISSLFNHQQTPRDVIKHIVKHEYLHRELPGVTGDPQKDHPPEFRERLAAMSPEAGIVSAWIYIHFSGACRYVKSKHKHWEITRRGYKSHITRPRCSLEQCANIIGRSASF